MLQIDNQIKIKDSEVEILAIRSQGPGGQNVNKVASAIHLRFCIHNSSLPDPIKQRLLELNDYRVSRAGIIIIKAQRYRTKERNLEDAFNRLRTLILSAKQVKRKRIKTLPTKNMKLKRREDKKRKSKTKRLRTKVDMND
jgi:ribosome-associated protein